jgi:hypothetical protein
VALSPPPSTTTPPSTFLPRRALLRGTAWSAPAITLAVAAPALAASPPGPVPNDEANYFWDVSADAPFLSVSPAESDLQFQASAQISYRAEPWVPPPAGASLQVIITLSQPARLAGIGDGWDITPAVGSTAEEFTFTRTPSSQGGGLTGTFFGTEAGEITVQGVMSLLHPGEATWAEEPASDSGVLVT